MKKENDEIFLLFLTINRIDIDGLAQKDQWFFDFQEKKRTISGTSYYHSPFSFTCIERDIFNLVFGIYLGTSLENKIGDIIDIEFKIVTKKLRMNERVERLRFNQENGACYLHQFYPIRSVMNSKYFSNFCLFWKKVLR